MLPKQNITTKQAQISSHISWYWHTFCDFPQTIIIATIANTANIMQKITLYTVVFSYIFST